MSELSQTEQLRELNDKLEKEIALLGNIAKEPFRFEAAINDVVEEAEFTYLDDSLNDNTKVFQLYHSIICIRNLLKLK